MREIKFRAWDSQTKQMHTQESLGISAGSMLNWYSELMQCTGLHDSSGKEVYEGDIVGCVERWIEKDTKLVEETNDGILQVFFSNYGWEFVGKIRTSDGDVITLKRLNFSDYIEGRSWGDGIEEFNRDFRCVTRYMDFEVIGNIYEHKELLEE